MTIALAYNPFFLALRFLLEVFALGCYAVWGWRAVPGPLRFVAAIAVPVAMAMLWGNFATAGDEARSGETTFDTPGPLRLLLELAVLGGAWAALRHIGALQVAKYYLIVLVVYHVCAYDRIWWLLRH
ncbi:MULTISPECIES: YrdB family protein [Streptomyces]|jgi:hypothetical protein|uniref:DUF2568 domain-containing protein n=4 Tax=Streptomyces TaxID=1883 RepID=A0A8I0P2D9_9ACTN|nr:MULTISPECIES: YrdB family protein [Streptomyces]EMF55877.1 putative integral inner membrane protein [Streptomyces bottropensis ATCC 25435]MBE1596950.1 hypothetical protein [Streptomyces stelliscabiei]MDX2522545.1 YrdB family protein [Streptomyces stelliscabiei]MDX2551509.1 YrdB family protein [Streptomyces stelliscabiei]MDX2617785.1 YrdB family protein [Streptomyces stelliscabiei]